MKYQVWKGDPFQQPHPAEGITVFCKEEDGYWWMRTPDSWGWVILNKTEPDVFGAAIEDLVRLANLAEGEPDPARDAIEKFHRAWVGLLEHVAPVAVTSPMPDKVPSATINPSNTAGVDDDIPF